ncbi:glycosyltransferase [Clostridium botulinum]
MKVAVVANCDILSEDNLGVFKKMYGQIQAFLYYGNEIDFFYNKSYMLIKEDINEKTNETIRPCNSEDRYCKLIKYIKEKEYNLIYMRYPMSDYYFLKFLYNIKLINKNIKIVIDFPTYPYENEIKDNVDFLSIDIYFRKLLYNYVDFGICYNNVSKIFNIPVYNIGNGIDISTIKKKTHIEKINEKEINLIGVANLSFWHGYDRIINGIKNYYNNGGNYTINFYVVGIGNELANLINIVEKNALKEYVKFLGVKKGNELDEIFNLCDIGVGSLGMYRKGLIDGSELKNREYCSRGIPFIFAYNDKDFPKNFKYAMKVKNDNSNIDINSIIKFYEELKTDNDVIYNMRSYAEKNLTWKKKMGIVLE